MVFRRMSNNPLYLLAIPLAIFLIILIGMSVTVRSSSDQSAGVLTESDFARDSELSAIPEGGIVATFLEPPTATGEENDTGAIGLDIIPYKYTEAIEQTFCWDDDNESAEHSMTLLDSEGAEVFTVEAAGVALLVPLVKGTMKCIFVTMANQMKEWLSS